MVEWLAVAPILPERQEAWRRFCQDALDGWRAGYEESRYRLGIRRELRWILLLGVAGALLGAAISYGILRWLGFSASEALLLSAVLAATDPVSIFAAMRRLRVPERMRVTLEGESLANDGVAAVLFAVALTAIGGRGSSPSGAVWQFLLLTVGGLLAGGLVGLVLARLLPDRVPVLAPATVVAAYGTYLLADRLGVSGLLAVVMLAGLTLSRVPSGPAST